VTFWTIHATQNHGCTPAQYALVVAAGYLVGFAVGTPLAGWLLNRIGQRLTCAGFYVAAVRLHRRSTDRPEGADHLERVGLRAAMDLARLRQRRGKRDEARALLAPLHAAFIEGLELQDLQDAGALLNELA
jgi:hypothetical protein